MKGVAEQLRSDNGSEFVAKDLRKWLANTGTNPLYIKPCSPWENGYCERFNSKLRDEFLNGEIFRSAWIARSFVNLAKCPNFQSHFFCQSASPPNTTNKQ
jgi:transposase InsO family protein